MPPSTKKIRIFSFSWRDLAIFCALFGSAVLLCILLHMASSSEGFAYSIFILTVLLISRFTTGYLFGTLAAVLSVVGTNYIFTYPYWAVNFTLSGYPLTFLTMLVVSLVTCTMTTKIKRQEDLRIEAAREKMRANLLRSVSHDIRTPLTSIIGSTRLPFQRVCCRWMLSVQGSTGRHRWIAAIRDQGLFPSLHQIRLILGISAFDLFLLNH